MWNFVALCLNIVFNEAMHDKELIQADKDLILQHGGPTKVADLLGLDPRNGGAQRVQNWMTRGIPSQVKLDHPNLFLPNFKVESPG